MAALSPADIAVPIRSLLAASRNIRVIKAHAERVDIEPKRVVTDSGEFAYDFLLLACGAQHAYFGHEEWEEYAPGLKTLPQATEIRRRVLEAFEAAERETDADARRTAPYLRRRRRRPDRRGARGRHRRNESLHAGA